MLTSVVVVKKTLKTLTINEQKIWKKYVEDLSETSSDQVLSIKNNEFKSQTVSLFVKEQKKRRVNQPYKQDFNNSLMIDKKVFSKLKSGRLKPERVLDLHGVTYDNAQERVLHFINQAYRDEKRLVLIITGKGKKTKEKGDFLIHRRGIIKQSLPVWLNKGSLKGLILNVSLAHVSHGGSGAYYVYLRKNIHKT